MEPVQVTFHGVDHSDALEAHIREKATRLRSQFPRLQRIRVVVELPHRSHQAWNLFQMKLELIVPHKEPLIITRQAQLEGLKESVYTLTNEVFTAASRTLNSSTGPHRKDQRKDMHEVFGSLAYSEGPLN